MKILYTSLLRFPTERAHGAQVAHMCDAFAQNNHDVTLLVSKRKNRITEDPFVYYGLLECFSIKCIKSTPWSVRSKLGFYSNAILFSLKSAFYARKMRPDILYSRDQFLLWVTLLVAPNLKLVWESHEARFNLFARSLLKKGVKCVVISEGIRDFYLGKGVSKEQLLVAHDGIDESFFGPVETKEEARTRLGISSDKPVTMYIGGLDVWKGVETFLEASNVTSSLSFVVIGGTDEDVEKYTKRFPKVTFLGRRPYRELKDNQQAADVLVCTGSTKNELSEKYTSPLKLFGYMTSKVPIVAADVPSIRNIVSEGEVLFYDSGSAICLVEKIFEVADKFNESKSRAEQACSTSRLFIWVGRAKRILNFVQES